jgi:hypothetical protein
MGCVAAHVCICHTQAHIERYADLRVPAEELLNATPLKISLSGQTISAERLDTILQRAGLADHTTAERAKRGNTIPQRNARPHAHNLTLAALEAALRSSTHVPTGAAASDVIARLFRMARAYGYDDECLGAA